MNSDSESEVTFRMHESLWSEPDASYVNDSRDVTWTPASDGFRCGPESGSESPETKNSVHINIGHSVTVSNNFNLSQDNASLNPKPIPSVSSRSVTDIDKNALPVETNDAHLLLRSRCAMGDQCTHGRGIVFNSRISPSPSTVRSRRRRKLANRSLNLTDCSKDSLTFLDGAGDGVLCEPCGKNNLVLRKLPTLGLKCASLANGNLKHDQHVQGLSVLDEKESSSKYIPQNLEEVHAQNFKSTLLVQSQLYDRFLREKASEESVSYGNSMMRLKKRSRPVQNDSPDTNKDAAFEMRYLRSTAKEKKIKERENQQEWKMMHEDRVQLTSDESPRKSMNSSFTSEVSINSARRQLFRDGAADETHDATQVAGPKVLESAQDWVTASRGRNLSPESGFGDETSSPGVNWSPSFIPGEDFVFSEEEGWDTPRKIEASTRRLSIHQLRNHYIAYASDSELQDWGRSPRTDYTYSSSLSYRALSPHKRVGSPNMARRPLHGAAPGADSDTSKGDRVLSSGSSPMQQYYDSKSSRRTTTTYIHNDADSDDDENSWRDVVKSQDAALASTQRMASSATTTTTSSVSMTRTVSFGLDYESDGDDLSPARSGSKRKHLSHRATPLLASSHLTSSTANHVPSLLSSPNGRALYATEEQQLVQNRALLGLIDGFSYTVNQLARIPAVLTQTLVSLTSHSSARHNGNVDNSNSKNVTFTQDRWSLSNSISKTPNAVEVKKSPMVLRSRRRVMGRTDSRNDEEVEISENTQKQPFESLPEDRLTDTANQKSFTSRSAFSIFYTLMTLIVWATSTAASSVYDVSKNIIDASYSTLATAAGSVTNYSAVHDGKIETDGKEDCEVVQEIRTREETEDMDDPNVRPLSWKDWLASLLPLVGGKTKRRRSRKLWDEHGMDTRSKTHRGNNKASFGADDITEHDFDIDVDELDGDHSSSNVTTVVTTVVTTIVETVYDLGFEIEEIGRKVVGAPSRRQERDLQKRLRLAGYKSDYYDRTVYSTSGSVKRSFAGDDDSAGVAWCCWLLPLLLLLGCAALAGLAYWYGSENVYAAVSSSATRVTSAVSFLATRTSEFLREAAFSLANWVEYIFWALSYPFVYAYNNAFLWLSQDPANSGGHRVYDSVVSVVKAGAVGVTSIAQSAFTSVLSFCLWVFGGISTLLIYIWELMQVLCSWVASVVSSTSSTASESLSSGASKTVEGLWSGLLWSWAGLASAAGALASLVSTCVSATAGLARSAQLTVAPASNTPSPPVVLPSSSSGGPSVDDLVTLVLQSETLHQQLGVKVSSEVAAQTSPTAAQLLELQHSSTAAQTRTQQLLEQLQLYHDSLKQQLAQLNESLSLVAAEGSQGRADLSAVVLEQKREREQQMKQLQDTLRDMNQQISKVQEEQVSLSAELKSCCQKTVLTLEDVERHVNGLISALIGGSGGGDTTSPADLKAWIGTYFIAKDEMETQMADMMNKLKLHADKAGGERGSLEEVALAQTQQLVMERVTEALQGELSARMQQQVSSQIPEVLEAHLQSAEFKNLVQREVKPSVQAEVAGQLTSHVAESQQFAQSLQAKISSTLEPMVEAEVEKAKSSVVAHLEPQIHSHVSFAVKDRVKEEVRESLVDGEGEGSLAAIVNDRVNEAYRLHNEETNVAFEQLQEQVSAKITGAVQTKQLNDTIKVLVAEAIALHMQNEGETSGALNMAARVALGGIGVGDAGAQLPLSRREVETIVTDALKKYDADRTGLVDHALESGGGSIVSTRCTEAYEVNQAEVSILGIPLYRYATNTPRSIIQPDRHPGQCWAFKGSQGYVVIRLVTSVRPTGFSLEHIPKSIAPFGVIDSAPKNFSMWGLATEKDEGVLLGSYQYREDGDALQYFPVEEVPEDYFPFIEFKIESNHGNMKYTCVYRVRVHGIRMQ